MKKNILVIFVVIGVFGVVAYLLKDRLKTLLGERPTGIPSPEMEDSAYRKISIPNSGYRYPFRPLTEIIGRTGESPARWLIEEIAPILKPMYPQRYIAITKGLLAYLVKGETPVPPEMGEFGYKPRPTNGPYSWALPQF